MSTPKCMCFPIMFTEPFRFLVVILLGFLPVQCVNAQTAPKQWATAIFNDGGDGDAPHLLQLERVSEGDPLIGKFALQKLEYQKRKADSPFVIEGRQGQDGTFWPNAQLEVQTKPDGKWLKVASSLDATVTARLDVYYGMVASGLYVDLQPFKAYIGKCSHGRIVLKSGEDTVISFKDFARWFAGTRETEK